MTNAKDTGAQARSPRRDGKGQSLYEELKHALGPEADEQELHKALEQLNEECLTPVIAVVRRARSYTIEEIHELWQDLVVEIPEIVEDFDSTRGASFMTYLVNRALERMWQLERDRKAEAKAWRDASRALHWMEEDRYEGPRWSERDYAALNRAMGRLRPDERYLLRLRYVRGLKPGEIVSRGLGEGRSAKQLSDTIRYIRQKLRNYMEEAYSHETE